MKKAVFHILNSVIDFIKTFSAVFKIGGGIIIFALFCLLSKTLSKLFLKITGKIFFSKNENLRLTYNTSLERPVRILFIIIGLFIGVYINFTNSAVVSAFQIACILIISWCIVSFISENLTSVLHLGDDSGSVNGAAVKFISNILKAVIVMLAIVMVVSELGYNISGLITGLGVGGLAVSLAAQSTLQDLISGFVLIFDRPFNVGDVIETDCFKGTVEDITMRSTRVRLFDDSVIIVPNTTLSNASIINHAMLTKRLFEIKVGLVYSTKSDVLLKCENEIRKYLESLPETDKGNIRVRFAEYEASALALEIRCYVNVTDIEEYYKITEEINYKLKEIIESNDTDFAFDTKSIIVENGKDD
ncbi:MAG: mechanosensitive ion channel family protein [Clostridiales bacterium]|nr:mechanosensitive ion channel family protein [Clostridiales bacterium]